jgi:hypothetical protein
LLALPPAVGDSWTHPILNVTVRRYPSTNPASAVVTLCRYYRPEIPVSCKYALDYDCDGLTGLDDPDCAQYM